MFGCKARVMAVNTAYFGRIGACSKTALHRDRRWGGQLRGG
ncbi:hypothetical protein [Acinetobacter baumannii]|nr:hypothetical protein [Acinetobacter baumannii]